MRTLGCIGFAVLFLAGVVWAGWALGIVKFTGATPAMQGTIPAEVADVSTRLTTGPLVLPVKGVRREALTDNWHDAREGGARVHEAIDIPAPGGTPVVAAMAGRIEKLFASRLGGTTIYLRAADPRWQTYYAHLSGYVPGLREGQFVAQGETIGFVGDTGDAGPGNTHLHFALNRMNATDGWWQGRAVNPFPLLAGKPPAR